MNKIWLIIQREYLSRVKKRSFILTTLLTPLAILLFIVVVGVIFSYESDVSKEIVILDEADVLNNTIRDDKSMYFRFSNQSLEELKAEYQEKEDAFDGILYIPEIKDLREKNIKIYYYSDEALEMDASMAIQDMIRNRIRDYKIDQLAFDRDALASLETRVSIDPEPIAEEGEDSSSISGVIGTALGGAMGYIMFFVIILYGNMVMRSVMEEKMNRIVEIIISSVKPFNLLLGKIIGVGGVGLTQLLIWAILIPIIFIIGQLAFGFDPGQMNEMNPGAANMDPDDMPFDIAKITYELSNQNWWLIIPMFFIYFFGGYIIYTSLYAAVGAAMGDDLQEGQSLTIPITIPIILALYIMFRVVSAPNSSLAVWTSIFPFFSPIIMPARLTFDPPTWEIIVSVLVLIGFSIFSVWFSARIYRIGILMYGKKASFKEIGKWLFRSN